MAQFNRAVIFSGHMIDPRGRTPRRFPVECVPAVSEAIQRQLAEWGTGPQTLAICGGAPGSDTLFAEACLGRGVHVRLLLPFSIENFWGEVFKGAAAHWRDRFEALLPRCEVLCQPNCLGPLPPGVTAYERNNRWILDDARSGFSRESIFPLLVWDQQETGDGPGGAADFAARAATSLREIVVINPTKLAC
jgi:hypothetical protein